MKKIDNLIVVFMFFMFTSSFASKFDFKREWTIDVKGPGTLIPYPDEKNPNSMICNSGNGVLRIDGKGEILFEYATGKGSFNRPAAADIDGDGEAEIVQATHGGEVHCINGKGQFIWKTDLKDILYDFGSVVISDIDQDDKKEIFINAIEGNLYCLNYDGSLKWKIYAEPRACSPAVGDIDGDGNAEIVYGTDVGKIFCLNNKGEYLWHSEIFGRAVGRSAPFLADLNNDGRYEVLMPHSSDSPDPGILCLDAQNGKFLWKGGTKMQNYIGTSIVDLDRDGKYEVMVVDKGNTVSVYEDNGKRKWQTMLSGHGIFYAAAVADFDADGHYEILCSCRQTGPEGQTMFLLNEKGEKLKEFKEGKSRNVSPFIADLDQDGILEIYMSDGRSDNQVYRYSFEGTKKGGEVLWSCWKNASSNDGYIPSKSRKKIKVQSERPRFGMADPKLQPVFIGKNQKTITVPLNGQNKDLIVETRLTDETGKMSATFEWPQNAGTEISVPFYVNSLQQMQHTIVVRDRKTGKILYTEKNVVSAKKFQKDIAAVREGKDEMVAITSTLKAADLEMANKMNAEFNQKEQFLHDCLKKVGNSVSPEFIHLMEKNRSELDKLSKYARFFKRIRNVGNDELFYVWEDENPWDEKQPDDIYPQKVTKDSSLINLMALGNEVEAKAFYLTNLTNKAQFVKVYLYDILGKDGKKVIKGSKAIDLREAINTPDAKAKMVDEVLPKLNEGNTILLPAQGSRKLWLSINTREFEPGTYSCFIGFEAIGMTVSVQTIKLNMTVRNIAVPEKSEFGFCTWSYLPHYAADPEILESVVKDLISHKVTVFQVFPIQEFD